MAVIAVLAAGLLAAGVYPRPPDAIEIAYVYSTDLAPLIEPKIGEFNNGGLVVEDRPVHVTGVGLTSDEAMKDIQLGNIEADTWTPTASVWGSLYRGLRTDVKIETEVPSLVNSPLVIAMRRECALALGWPDGDQPSWDEVGHLARTHGRGTPHCEHFALGGTDPNKSTSGLLAVASWYDVANGDDRVTVRTLEPKDPSRADVRAMQKSVIQYWATSEEVVLHMCENSAPYLDAVFLEENLLVSQADNACLRKVSSSGMVAVYPSGATYVADYPMYRVTRPDSTGATEQAAALFGIWLQGQLTPTLVEANGFRTADGSPPQGLLGDGVLPLLPAFGDVVPMPSQQVAELLQAAWRADCGTDRCNV